VARVQLALNVSNLNEAIAFYTKLFGRAPAKVQPGYANFAITDPPLKLVLMEDPETRDTGVVGALNHLGVEVSTPGEVGDASRRLRAEGFETEEQRATTCCYAVQDKVWVEDPDHRPWEIYTVLADAPSESTGDGDGKCCATAGVAIVTPDTCC
jgi:catechol 2,3-dioxygenase-like lactoylglutathione lyase family enzyme